MLAPADTPAYLDLRYDWRLLAFVTALGAFATVVFGLVPALRASAVAPIHALKTSGARHTTRIRLLRPLVSVQVAFSLAVLFLAGLLMASFARLSHVDPGFDPAGIALVDVTPLDPKGPSRGIDPMLRLVDAVRQSPQVSAASVSAWPLFAGMGWSGAVHLPGRRWDGVDVYFLEVSPGFIGTMRIPLLAGRDFDRRDLDEGSPSVLANETFVRKYCPGALPVGGQFIRPERSSEATPEIEKTQIVVGVVGDAKYNDLRETTPPTVYVPIRASQQPDQPRGGTLEIRSRLGLNAVAGAVRDLARRTTPDLKVSGATLQSTLITNTMLRERLLALLSGFFGLISLALAGVGLYGVLSYSVVQQRRDIGIRVALGARQRAIVAGVVQGVAGYVGVGIAVGVSCGLWLAQFFEKLLYDVRSRDGISMVLPILELLLVAIIAALLPARRAARVDPIVVLRDE
jgi:predicted permease